MLYGKLENDVIGVKEVCCRAYFCNIFWCTAYLASGMFESPMGVSLPLWHKALHGHGLSSDSQVWRQRLLLSRWKLWKLLWNYRCVDNNCMKTTEIETLKTKFMDTLKRAMKQHSIDIHSNVNNSCNMKHLKDTNKFIDSLISYPAIKRIFMKYNTAIPSSEPVEL